MGDGKVPMTGEPRTYELGSLDRALEILSVLAEHPGSRLAELSAHLGANGTTVLRALRVLERNGFVRRAPAGYFLGARLTELGHAAAGSVDIAADLTPALTALGRDERATAHIGMLRAGMVTVIAKIEPPNPLVRYSTLGTRMPLHATATGKAALALLGDEALGELAAHGLAAYTPATILDPEALAVEVRRAREERFAREEGEYQAGFVCVATAFRAEEEIYTVSLSSPLVDDDALSRRGARLVETLDAVLGEHGIGAARL